MGALMWQLNNQGMLSLMAEMNQNQRHVFFLMEQGMEMTDRVTKVDLTGIIWVLCNKLNWIERNEENPKMSSNNELCESGIEDKLNVYHSTSKQKFTKPDEGRETEDTTSDIFSESSEKSPLDEVMETHGKKVEEGYQVSSNFEEMYSEKSDVTSTVTVGSFNDGSKESYIADDPPNFFSCNKELPNNPKEDKRTLEDDKPFSCSKCDFKCKKFINLRTHERIHTSDKPFNCSQCGYKCTQLSNLKKHERIHTGDKPFSCPYCDLKCSDPSTMRRHKLTHGGSKPFHCSQCEYKCIRKRELTEHERTHTGDKPFRCTKCSYKSSHGFR